MLHPMRGSGTFKDKPAPLAQNNASMRAGNRSEKDGTNEPCATRPQTKGTFSVPCFGVASASATKNFTVRAQHDPSLGYRKRPPVLQTGAPFFGNPDPVFEQPRVSKMRRRECGAGAEK